MNTVLQANPILILEQGAVAVDAMIRLADGAPQ